MSAECILRYGTDPETYLRGDAEDATELMGIFVKRIDDDDPSAVGTYRFTSLGEPQTAGRRRQTVALEPAS